MVRTKRVTISISEETLKAIDKKAKQYRSRSHYIETIILKNINSKK